MAPVLKTGEAKASVGSNPTLSVSELKTGIPKGSRDVPLIPETRCPAVGFLLFGRPPPVSGKMSPLSSVHPGA